jgi:hypothetical protein
MEAKIDISSLENEKYWFKIGAARGISKHAIKKREPEKVSNLDKPSLVVV